MPVRSEPVSLFLFYGLKSQSSREDVIVVSPTRTTARPTTGATLCRTLVEHVNDEIDSKRTPEDEERAMKLADIEAEATRMLVRRLLIRRFLSWLFFMKGRHEIPIGPRHLDSIKDKVSCSAMNTLIADKSNLLEELLESAAKHACGEVIGATFVRFIPNKAAADALSSAHANTFTFEVDIV